MSKHRIRSAKRSKPSEVILEAPELLQTFQCAVRLLSKEMEELSGVTGLSAETRVLWFEYLFAWSRGGYDITKYFCSKRIGSKVKKREGDEGIRTKRGGCEDSTDREEFLKDDEEKEEERYQGIKNYRRPSPCTPPPPPTRNLILGLLALAARNLRSWLLPCDMVSYHSRDLD